MTQLKILPDLIYSKNLTKNQLWLRKVDFDLSIKSSLNNDIRVKTVIKQADIDTQLLILL